MRWLAALLGLTLLSVISIIFTNFVITRFDFFATKPINATEELEENNLNETGTAVSLVSHQMLSGLATNSSTGSLISHPNLTRPLDGTDAAPLLQASFYSAARTDRSGSAILDMLLAHAYSFHQNLTYRGACWTYPETDKRKGRLRTHRKLIQGIGLESELKFACPQNRSEVVDASVYRRVLFSDAFNASWLRYIRSVVKYPNRSNQDNIETVIHIRRGDVKPCSRGGKNGPYRYLPNSHFKSIIKKYVPKESSITIFSEKESFEPWSDFVPSNYSLQLQLDTDIHSVWRSMMMADILVLSNSAFSYVPAALNRKGQVIYSPFWHDKLHNWTTVSSDIFNSSREEVLKLCKKEMTMRRHSGVKGKRSYA